MEDPDRRVPAEPLPVLVLHDGAWIPGWLSQWARWDAVGWRGLVSYTVTPGSQFLRWRPAAEIQQRTT